jgi:hypothetical protein
MRSIECWLLLPLSHSSRLPSSQFHSGSVPLHHRFPKCQPLGKGMRSELSLRSGGESSNLLTIMRELGLVTMNFHAAKIFYGHNTDGAELELDWFNASLQKYFRWDRSMRLTAPHFARWSSRAPLCHPVFGSMSVFVLFGMYRHTISVGSSRHGRRTFRAQKGNRCRT